MKILVNQSIRIYIILIVIFFTSFNKSVYSEDSTFVAKGKFISTLFANYHLLSNNNSTITEFQLNRAYLGYDYSFSKEVKTVIILDFGDPQGVGNIYKMSAFLKNAYLQYKSDFFTINFGLIPTKQMQLSEKVWQRRYIMKSLQDQYKFGFTADYGFNFEFSPLNNLSFDFGVLNGFGHTNPIHEDNIYRRNLGLTYFPIKNVPVRLYWDITNSDSVFRKTYHFLSGYSATRYGVYSEFALQESYNFKKNQNLLALSLYGHYDLDDRWTSFLRFDRLVSNTLHSEAEPWNINNDGYQCILGVENRLAKGVKISPNVQIFIPDIKSNGILFGFFLNLEAKI